MILEGIVTTLGPDGSLNVAPMGPKVEPGDFGCFILRPYRTSTTYRNLESHGEGVLHVTDDVLMIARGAVGKIDDAPTRPADVVQGRVIMSSCRYYEFRVVDLDDREDRTTITAETVASGRLRDFFGLNRAKLAVVEAAILATRLDFLPMTEVQAQYDRLAVLVQKTGGPDEHAAFALLREHVDRRAGPSDAGVVPAAVEVRSPSRLHFGPLAWGPSAPRRFGGVGLMIDRPGLVLRADRAEAWSAHGPLADRAIDMARRVASSLEAQGVSVPSLRLRIDQAPPEHVGLGTGTQLGLAVARAVTVLSGHDREPVETLAPLLGRGRRSGIGLLGFERGNLIVEGGHRDPDRPPPLIVSKTLPESWSVLVVLPSARAGLHGEAEREAFRDLPPIPDAMTDRLCRLVLLGLLPAIEENDLSTFGEALAAIQDLVGRWFAPAQGGLFAGPEVEAVARFLRDQGVRGVGQSSWGPTLYGFDDGPPEGRSALLDALRDRFGLNISAAYWTRPSRQGTVWVPIEPATTDSNEGGSD